jgi:hypothetical protein
VVPEPVCDGLACPKYANLSFLLHVTDGRMRVWRHKDTAYTPRNIQPTVPYGGGSVMVWGVFLMTANWDVLL